MKPQFHESQVMLLKVQYDSQKYRINYVSKCVMHLKSNNREMYQANIEKKKVKN